MTTNAHEVGTALLGEGAVIVWNDVAPDGREQFYTWHDKEHIPERLALPGFRRGRRFVRPGHSPEWLTIYEADDLHVVNSPAYLARLNAPTPATMTSLKYFRNTSRAVCTLVYSIGSSSGGHMLALRLSVPAVREAAVRNYFTSRGFPRALEATGVLACHLFAADAGASFTNTAESSTRRFDVPSWVLLVESTTESSAVSARAILETDELRQLGVEVREDAAVYALEICRLSQEAA